MCVTKLQNCLEILVWRLIAQGVNMFELKIGWHKYPTNKQFW